MTPDFLVIGHLTRDEHPEGDTLGGAATFASIAARNLGYRTAILTSAADDFPTPELLHDIEIVRLPSPTTTTFRNIYDGLHRQQYVRDIALPLCVAHLPAAWRQAKIALLGPLVGELEDALARAFSDETLVGVVPQGWMRAWDQTGRVRHVPWRNAERVLPYVRVLVLSEEDLGDHKEQLEQFVALTPIVALTRGAQGARIYLNGELCVESPAFPTRIVDPTGAGDTFTAAFLIRLYETGDPIQAARFANAAASLAIESVGAANMPTRAMVEARLRE